MTVDSEFRKDDKYQWENNQRFVYTVGFKSELTLIRVA